MFDGQRFSRGRPNPAGTGEPRASDQQVRDQNKQQPHREPSFSPFRPFRKSAQQLGLPSELPIRHTRSLILVFLVSLPPYSHKLFSCAEVSTAVSSEMSLRRPF